MNFRREMEVVSEDLQQQFLTRIDELGITITYDLSIQFRKAFRNKVSKLDLSELTIDDIMEMFESIREFYIGFGFTNAWIDYASNEEIEQDVELWKDTPYTEEKEIDLTNGQYDYEINE